MSPKREPGKDSLIARRKWLTLDQKLEIIRLHEEGSTFAKIGREKGMDESSVRKLVKKKDLYKSYGLSTSCYLSKSITKNKSSRMINMERLLLIWIQDLNQKNIPLSQIEIQTKALSLYNDLKGSEEEETKNDNFRASRGWFFRFKKRTGINIIRVVGKSARANSALDYPFKLNEIMYKGAYRVSNNDHSDDKAFIDLNKEPGIDDKETSVDSDVDLNQEPTRELTAEALYKIISSTESLSLHIMKVDPNIERGMAVHKTINNAIQCYTDMYEEKTTKKDFVQK